MKNLLKTNHPPLSIFHWHIAFYILFFALILPTTSFATLYWSNYNINNTTVTYTNETIYSDQQLFIDAKLVIQGNLQNKSNTAIDISELQSGLYYIHIIENGVTVAKEKIVKQ